MKVKLLLIIVQILFTFFFNLSPVTAQNLTDFLPLQVGNIWVYECSTQGLYCGFCTGRTRVRISGSSVMNGRTYYQSETITNIFSNGCPTCGNTWVLPFSSMVRVDSQSANVFLYTTSGCPYTPGEKMLDSFKARLGDSIRMDCQPPSQWAAYICTDTNNVTIFGSSRQSRIYTHNGFEGGRQRRYAKGIGCYFVSSSGLEGGTYVCNRRMTLFGCVINGVLYGDTSMPVGIKQISTKIPQDYTLYQNYPNPFNPITNIKFDIPLLRGVAEGRGVFVSLIVYDFLGREIIQLVNQQMQAGGYNVDWDAVNYPSGVYFYKLDVHQDGSSTGDFVETKKMVLVK